MAKQSDALKPYVPAVLPQPSVSDARAPLSQDDMAQFKKWANDQHRVIANSMALLVQVSKQLDARLIAGGL